MRVQLSVFGPGHPFRGGIASTTTSLVESLRVRGHHARFVVPSHQYPEWLYPGGRDRDPTACHRLEDTTADFAPLEPWTWPRARRRALERADDLWIVPYWTWAWAAWERFLLASRRRPPVVAVVHNPADHEGGLVRRLAARLVLGRCDGLMTHANVLARQLKLAYPGIPVAAHPLPPPSTADQPPDRREARKRLAVSEGTRLALFLGFLRPYKGADVLLEAMGGLPASSPWKLVVAGEPWGGIERALQERVDDLALQDRVDLRLGWLPEPEFERLLAAADLVVLPYRSGTQSAVAPRALGRGIPVLSTRVGGLGEVIEDGVNGRLVEPGSHYEITRVLHELADPDRLATLTDGARRTAGRYTWAGYVKTLEALMIEVLG